MKYAVPGTAANDTVTRYTTSTPDHTHALTSTSTAVGTGTPVERAFGYDANGNMTSRVTDTGKSQTLTYDRHNWVDSVTTAGNTVSYEYDVDGNQLLRRDGATTTLYLPGQEVTVNTTTKATTVTSYYSHGGQVVATRQDDFNPRYLLPDQHGTNQVAISPVGWAVSRRYYDPFGSPRGTNPGWPDDKRFLGMSHDWTLGLTHIGAREYDPKLGRFLTVDPILDKTDGQSMNGYVYANSDPINKSDPTDLDLVDSPGSGCPAGQDCDPGGSEPSGGSGESGGLPSGDGDGSGGGDPQASDLGLPGFHGQILDCAA